MKTFIRSVCLLVVMFGSSVFATSVNLALPENGGSYSYPTGWPYNPGGMDGSWLADGSKTVLNDGLVDGAGYGFVITENEPLCAIFDLGVDRAIDRILMNAVVTPAGWGANAITGVQIYFKTAAAGPFNGGEGGTNFWGGYLAAEATGSVMITSVDKTSSVWAMDTGAISATARYVVVYTSGPGTGYQALTEASIFGVVPEPASVLLLSLGAFFMKTCKKI